MTPELLFGSKLEIPLKAIKNIKSKEHEQIEEVKSTKKYHNFEELLLTNDIWEVK